jgi:phosphonate transport system substrate-binding protein
MPSLIRRLICPFVALAGLLLAAAASAAAPLILVVHPYLSAAEINQRFAPLARHLAAAIGREVAIRVPRDYDEHINIVGRDEADIAFLGPASLLAIEEKYGARPLLGRLEVGGHLELGGHFIVRRDSPLKSLTDLRGKRIAFGDPQSTMSHLVPKAMLRSAGIADNELLAVSSVGSHDNIALAVLAGDYDAGAVKDEIFDKYAARGLRSLAELPRVADHAFIASRRLPGETVERLRGALHGLRDSEAGRSILASIQSNLTAIVPARAGDYDSLRRLLLHPTGRKRQP